MQTTLIRQPLITFAFLPIPNQGRIKVSAGPGAVPNVGPLQTYNST